MYERILMAVDGSVSCARALDEAIRMAKLSGAKIYAVSVVDKTPLFMYGGYYDPVALLAGFRRGGCHVLAEAEAKCREAHVAAEAELIETDDLKDDIATCLQCYAERIGADLAVLGTHGRRGVRRLVLGSVAERFARASTVPVLLVRSEADEAPAAPAA